MGSERLIGGWINLGFLGFGMKRTLFILVLSTRPGGTEGRYLRMVSERGLRVFFRWR